MGLEGGGRFKGDGTCVYLWLTHVDVWQKPIQHFKAIILQFKKIKKEYAHAIKLQTHIVLMSCSDIGIIL